MNRHCGGGGRHLQPGNFAKEIFIRVHMPPMDKLDDLTKYVLEIRIVVDGVRYRRKQESTRPDKLKSVLGQAIESYRYSHWKHKWIQIYLSFRERESSKYLMPDVKNV